LVRRALIFHGGWEGHEPLAVGEIFRSVLAGNGFDVTLADSLEALLDDRLDELSLIVPVWTMGEIGDAELARLCRAVEAGVGLAGCHGGMGDAFRDSPDYQLMVGGQFVGHPGDDGITYDVHISDSGHPLTAGIDDFSITSEQYYMHVDPSNTVLATTSFPVADGPHVPNGPFEMPVAWTRRHGAGRVFYCSLGHDARIVALPPVLELCTRGLLWAARAE
jgi:type 1 glutamine amidotransferase